MKLPTGHSGKEVRRVLEQVGFTYQRRKGSHMILRKVDPYSRVVVPDYETLRLGTLRQILNEAGLTVEQLIALL